MVMRIKFSKRNWDSMVAVDRMSLVYECYEIMRDKWETAKKK